MTTLRALALLGLCALLGACDSDDSPPPANSSSGGTTATCANDSRVKAYASGLKATSPSGRLVAEIVSATPSPPQRGSGDAGMNTWSVRLTLDGAAAQGDIVVIAEMPDHGHASPRVPKATANSDGTFNVEPLFLFMGGVWEISFNIGTERAMFSLCVD